MLQIAIIQGKLEALTAGLLKWLCNMVASRVEAKAITKSVALTERPILKPDLQLFAECGKIYKSVFIRGESMA